MTRILPLSAALSALTALAACQATPGDPAHNVPVGPYVLVGIGSDTVPQRNVGMTIERDGSVSGQAPCNHFSARQTAEPPGFALGSLTTSQNECGGNAGRLESRFFQALSAANGIEYSGGVLTVKGPTYLTFEPGYRKE